MKASVLLLINKKFSHLSKISKKIVKNLFIQRKNQLKNVLVNPIFVSYQLGQIVLMMKFFIANYFFTI